MKVKASTLLSSVFVLATCLLFIRFYQDIYHDSMQNDLLLIEYLVNN
ncbi:hypothetical protein [Lactobacillus sp. ESL0230]|nr:hypothetical protein [Lactobacillus sp. ESL0230]